MAALMIWPIDLLASLDRFNIMSEKQKEWWSGLPNELQKDIELEE